MVPVTEEEKKLPYYKYYLRDLAPIPQEKLDIWQAAAADSALALPVEQRDRFLDETPLPLEVGFCVAPNGTGFVANATPLPGVTIEMFEWWFGWHCCAPLCAAFSSFSICIMASSICCVWLIS